MKRNRSCNKRLKIYNTNIRIWKESSKSSHRRPKRYVFYLKRKERLGQLLYTKRFSGEVISMTVHYWHYCTLHFSFFIWGFLISNGIPFTVSKQENITYSYFWIRKSRNWKLNYCHQKRKFHFCSRKKITMN